MEEEKKRIEREKRLSEFRITICEADKADADVEVIRADRALEAELENRGLAEEAIEAGKKG